jgi:eukaryotic-like serine/threonine-protein kinase
MTSRSRPVNVSASAADSAFNALVEEIVDRLQAGERVDFQEYRLRHPEQAEKLDQVIPAMKLMADLGRTVDPVGPAAAAEPEEPFVTIQGGHPAVLGDFRLLRQIGRGGMGIVYEAEQISLGRRVAVKVLHRAAALEPSLKVRFQLEARAAALLNHPHIVPVYAVEPEGELPYYAMQFIHGISLADVIAEMRGRIAPVVSCQLPVASCQ